MNASVPSPSINVLCAALTDEELDPVVYTRWPIHEVNDTRPGSSTWPAGFIDNIPRMPSFLNKTAVDDVFFWGEKYGRRHPIFSVIPNAFKSVFNSTDQISPKGYNQDSLYVLATSNVTNSSQICSIRASMYVSCFTEYHASISGGELTAHCNQPGNDLQYDTRYPDAKSFVPDHNWTQISNRWISQMSLGTRVNDDPSTNPRLLTELMLNETQLSPTKPSIAEALAVQAGCTVINTALDSPFTHYWNSTNRTRLDAPFWESFDATVQSQDYYSGPAKLWQYIFFIILVGILVMNIGCLCYFLGSQGLLTNLMTPYNLFALALNSPPSGVIEGASGTGDEKEQWSSTWNIKQDLGTKNLYIQSLDEPRTPSRKKEKSEARDAGWEMQFEDSPNPAK